jgi:hypothetical protein
MSAVAIQVNWRDLEPVQDKPDWSRLDAVFAAAESANKWVILEIAAGFFSPAWALQGAQTDTFEIQYGPDHATSAPLPMPWDRVYLGRWFTFVKQLADRYGRSPAFRMIAAAGPTSVSPEFTLPSSLPPAKRTSSNGPSGRLGEGWRCSRMISTPGERSSLRMTTPISSPATVGGSSQGS